MERKLGRGGVPSRAQAFGLQAHAGHQDQHARADAEAVRPVPVDGRQAPRVATLDDDAPVDVSPGAHDETCLEALDLVAHVVDFPAGEAAPGHGELPLRVHADAGNRPAEGVNRRWPSPSRLR
jgi:hypothetical protein